MFKQKPATRDYTKSMLPHTRKEVFFDVVRLHLRELLLCGIIVLAFSLPMHLLTLLEDSYIANVNAQLPENATEQQLGDAEHTLTAFRNFKTVLEIGLLALFSVGFSGLMRVIRQYAWEENVFFTRDLLKGIRQNIGQTLLLSLAVGILYAVCVIYYNLAPQNSVGISFLFFVPMGIFVLLVIPVAAYMTVCIPVYTAKFRQNALMGFVLYIRSPLKTLGVLAACGVVFLPYLLNNVYAHLLGRLLGSLAAPFLMLVWFLFSYDRLDQDINPKEHPELVGRGTFQE